MENIKEDNIIDNKSEVIDGFIQKGNISGLAHHYHNGDDNLKSSIISKAVAAKGEIFANRIKVNAKNLLEKLLKEFVEGEETELEETTTTASVGGQFNSKFFLQGKKLKEGEIPQQGQSDNSRIPSKVRRIAGEVHELITKCVDADGDPVGVYDSSSTWQETFVYNITVANNVVTIDSVNSQGKKDYPDVYDFNRPEDELIHVIQDCYMTLQHLRKQYVRTIKTISKQRNQPELDENQGEEITHDISSRQLVEFLGNLIEKFGDDHPTVQSVEGILEKYCNLDEADTPVDIQALAELNSVIDENFEAEYKQPADLGLEEFVDGSEKQTGESDIDVLMSEFGEENVNIRTETENAFQAVINAAGVKIILTSQFTNGEFNIVTINTANRQEKKITDNIDDAIEFIRQLEGSQVQPSGLLEAETVPTKKIVDKVTKENAKNTKAQVDKDIKAEVQDKKPKAEKVEDPTQEFRKGMEDLVYDVISPEAERAHKEAIDPKMKSAAVKDQFGNKIPAMDIEAEKTDVGKNINKKVADSKKKDKEPLYPKDPQPVKIVKEGIFKETDKYVITFEEKAKMDEEVLKFHALLKHNPSAKTNTFKNKKDADVLNKVRNLIK